MVLWKQWELLYVEALYTVKHRIGRSDESITDQELYHYLQSAFNMSPAEHERLFAKAGQEKVTSYCGQ